LNPEGDLGPHLPAAVLQAHGTAQAAIHSTAGAAAAHSTAAHGTPAAGATAARQGGAPAGWRGTAQMGGSSSAYAADLQASDIPQRTLPVHLVLLWRLPLCFAAAVVVLMTVRMLRRVGRHSKGLGPARKAL
jgi:hypothetical protein